MIGLALSGGGVKGSYQVGAYYAFKKCGIKFDGICGTSIGSFNGAMIVAHQEKELLNFWQNADVGNILGLDPKLVKKINEEEIDLEFYKLSFTAIKKIFENKGISIDGLQEVLATYNIEEKVRSSNVEFGLTTFRMKDRKALELFVSDMKEGSLNNYIIASCYLPLFKPEKLEDDSYFFDGGIHDNCPANMLLNKGYDQVYAVDLGAIGIRKKYIDESKVVVISPSRKISSILSVSQDEILDNIKLGYYDTLKVLKKYQGNKFIFKNIPKWYSKKICKKYNVELQDIIKNIEHFMEKDKLTYYKIYNIPKVLKLYKQHILNKQD